MPLTCIDQASAASGAANEDRAGMAGDFAWVIDGATDVVTERLTTAVSDAAWFAGEIEGHLKMLSHTYDGAMSDLPLHLARAAAKTFDRVATRQPSGRSEHPSAAGLIVRSTNAGLAYVALGDCTLFVRSAGGVTSYGVEDMRTGDAWVQDRIRALQAKAPDDDSLTMRASLWPELRRKRALMNMDGGYAVFSITPPPAHMIITGDLALEAGDVCLLASDGLTRLIDVFGTHNDESLIAAAEADGLAALIDRLRQLEIDDQECRAYPRAKTSDDATGLLMRFER